MTEIWKPMRFNLTEPSPRKFNHDFLGGESDPIPPPPEWLTDGLSTGLEGYDLPRQLNDSIDDSIDIEPEDPLSGVPEHEEPTTARFRRQVMERALEPDFSSEEHPQMPPGHPHQAPQPEYQDVGEVYQGYDRDPHVDDFDFDEGENTDQTGYPPQDPYDPYAQHGGGYPPQDAGHDPYDPYNQPAAEPGDYPKEQQQHYDPYSMPADNYEPAPFDQDSEGFMAPPQQQGFHPEAGPDPYQEEHYPANDPYGGAPEQPSAFGAPEPGYPEDPNFPEPEDFAPGAPPPADPYGQPQDYQGGADYHQEDFNQAQEFPQQEQGFGPDRTNFEVPRRPKTPPPPGDSGFPSPVDDFNQAPEFGGPGLSGPPAGYGPSDDDFAGGQQFGQAPPPEYSPPEPEHRDTDEFGRKENSLSGIPKPPGGEEFRLDMNKLSEQAPQQSKPDDAIDGSEGIDPTKFAPSGDSYYQQLSIDALKRSDDGKLHFNTGEDEKGPVDLPPEPDEELMARMAPISRPVDTSSVFAQPAAQESQPAPEPALREKPEPAGHASESTSAYRLAGVFWLIFAALTITSFVFLGNVSAGAAILSPALVVGALLLVGMRLSAYLGLIASLAYTGLFIWAGLDLINGGGAVRTQLLIEVIPPITPYLLIGLGAMTLLANLIMLPGRPGLIRAGLGGMIFILPAVFSALVLMASLADGPPNLLGRPINGYQEASITSEELNLGFVKPADWGEFPWSKVIDELEFVPEIPLPDAHFVNRAESMTVTFHEEDFGAGAAVAQFLRVRPPSELHPRLIGDLTPVEQEPLIKQRGSFEFEEQTYTGKLPNGVPISARIGMATAGGRYLFVSVYRSELSDTTLKDASAAMDSFTENLRELQ